jgi:threonine synthase
MGFVNIRQRDQQVSFADGVRKGLGEGGGLFFPQHIRPLPDLPGLLQEAFVSRSAVILHHLLDGEISLSSMQRMINAAFDFPLELVKTNGQVHALELFHGPSLAFKDFGARFMGQCLAEFHDGGPMTILTATSGDTGAAVAHAFLGQPGIRVVVLYPKGGITPLQEKLFCTLGENIETVAVEADFDTCQKLVKQAFDEPALRRSLGLNSANSINIARLLAQVCYYFEAAARLPAGTRPVYSVPSGNFGNITAGLVAQAAGLPIKRVIAATNANDTVPRFLASGHWDPRPTVPTMTNAMDISLPNNFPRVVELGEHHGVPLTDILRSVSITDAETANAVRELDDLGYLADPHSALGWLALQQDLAPNETGVFLCTAHPAKFRESIEDILQRHIDLPPELARVAQDEVLSKTIPGDFTALRNLLVNHPSCNLGG